MRHSQDKGKDLHQTMVKIQRSHDEHVNVLAAELSAAKWTIKIRDEMLRIITGGDREMIDALQRDALERIGPDPDVVG